MRARTTGMRSRCREIMERAAGIEPATSSSGTNARREIQRTIEINRAKFLNFFDRHTPCRNSHFRQFPAR